LTAALIGQSKNNEAFYVKSYRQLNWLEAVLLFPAVKKLGQECLRAFVNDQDLSRKIYDRCRKHFPPITDERRAGNFSRRAAGVVSAVSHRRMQQLRL
jgi:hypothetical protein